MQTGSLRFRVSSGAVLDFEGPVSLEFLNPMRLRLERGSINTDVGSEAKGFVVETPTANVLDIGTRFGTSVCADGSTDIAVFEGKFRFTGQDFRCRKKADSRALLKGRPRA